jgi:S-adenosylmethionine-diacylglycerol 3-amino-3-carboxypropyl transferase
VIGEKASFSFIRYAQCWEDADILVEGLSIGPSDHVLSIASAGDNSLALLAQGPERVIAIDLSPAQIACVELRVAAYRELSHPELLELMGSRPSTRRATLYARLRNQLSSETRALWEADSSRIERGIGAAGKFERYFKLFRTRVLPLLHSRRTTEALFAPRDLADRRAFYERTWGNRRWHWAFRLFFSRFVMGRLGRDPRFFDHVEGSVSDRILVRAKYAMTDLAPHDNPYLQWILLGTHDSALPYALRPENFDAIRKNLGRLSWRLHPLEEFARSEDCASVTRMNLSNVFEYLSPSDYEHLLRSLLAPCRSGTRIAYWNLLAPRRLPEALSGRLLSRNDLSIPLFAKDKAFFYSDFVLEEVR